MSSITEEKQALQVINDSSHQDCIAALNEFKDCISLFKELYNNQFFTTLSMISDYTGVSIETLRTAVKANREDLVADGSYVYDVNNVEEGWLFDNQVYGKIRLFTPRATLRLLLKLEKNNIGNQIATILLNNTEENKKKKKIKKTKTQFKGVSFRVDEKIIKGLDFLSNKNNFNRTELFKVLVLRELEKYDFDESDCLTKENIDEMVEDLYKQGLLKEEE